MRNILHLLLWLRHNAQAQGAPGISMTVYICILKTACHLNAMQLLLRALECCWALVLGKQYHLCDMQLSPSLLSLRRCLKLP